MNRLGANSNKAKIARRVIEVLEYFDANHQEATVMDIVRRYDRPQSSTSELLQSLVEYGLLYKNPTTRLYRPTPRAALIGTSGQPEPVRDGTLVRLIDGLASQTGYSVALIGMVDLDAQIYTCRHDPSAPAAVRELSSGRKDPLTRNAVGWLMLSTFPINRREGMVRRLNSEAPENFKFPHSEMMAQIESVEGQGFALGPAGFGSKAFGLSALLPRQIYDRPMAVSLIIPHTELVRQDELRNILVEAVEACRSECTIEEPEFLVTPFDQHATPDHHVSGLTG